MRNLGPVSDNEMVLAFLQAEIDSPRFRDRLNIVLSDGGTNRRIVTSANLENEEEKRLRRRALGSYRGFGQNQWLFVGFPQDIQWEKILLDKTDLKRLRYATCPIWVKALGREQTRHRWCTEHR